MRSVRIVVATHKAYSMPEDPVYLPVQVGPGEDLGYARDNTGPNISEKNPSYCELTALYWAAHNLDVDALGLAHYRRLLGEPGVPTRRRQILSGQSLDALLDTHALLLPKPRRYWIETTASHYVHAHHAGDLAILREVVAQQAPACLDAFDRVMGRTWGHRFNMFVMTRPLLDGYIPWLFGLLEAAEARIDTTGYNPYDARVMGFLAERLLDVWVEAEGLAYRELPCLYMEQINWPRKAGAFLWRKMKGGNR